MSRIGAVTSAVVVLRVDKGHLPRIVAVALDVIGVELVIKDAEPTHAYISGCSGVGVANFELEGIIDTVEERMVIGCVGGELTAARLHTDSTTLPVGE